jgi:hypothetical protein
LQNIGLSTKQRGEEKWLGAFHQPFGKRLAKTGIAAAIQCFRGSVSSSKPAHYQELGQPFCKRLITAFW